MTVRGVLFASKYFNVRAVTLVMQMMNANIKCTNYCLLYDKNIFVLIILISFSPKMYFYEKRDIFIME